LQLLIVTTGQWFGSGKGRPTAPGKGKDRRGGDQNTDGLIHLIFAPSQLAKFFTLKPFLKQKTIFFAIKFELFQCPL
jgi:hypothetical protein